MMMTEHGLVAPAAGGSVLTHFDTILATAAPELAGHVQVVGFDADTGRTAGLSACLRSRVLSSFVL